MNDDRLFSPEDLERARKAWNRRRIVAFGQAMLVIVVLYIVLRLIAAC